ncbi:Pr6Pr family membrane protein [uncultured Streptomyces sp.]|uniref:Pr6Pr family membrane protein n=1 Tax=uncultured Streptomyces sp. TaxID=174707 RepID=UPI0026098EF9|nr:Pr6Pr family membrane protein [uncultured Streptomyces sp.]
MTAPRTATLPRPRDADAFHRSERARRRIAGTGHALVCAVALAGVVIDLAAGAPLRTLTHFTVLTNLLAAGVFGRQAHRCLRGGKPLPPVLTGGALLFVMSAGLGYHLAQTGTAPDSPGPRVAADLLLYTAAPLAVTADWLLLTPPRTLRLRFLPLWLLYPAAYLTYVLIRGYLLPDGSPDRYAYAFLDVDTYGYPDVLAHALVLGLLCTLFATLLIGLDHLRPRPMGRRRPRRKRISPPGIGGLK